LGEVYAALRQPATRDDLPGARYVRAQLGERFRPRAASARLGAMAQSLADRIYLVSARAAVCVVSSARLEIGCDAEADPPTLITHTIICSPYLPIGIGEVYGIVPDADRRVRIELQGGSVVRPVVDANLFRYYWVKGRAPLPRVVLWQTEGRRRSVAVPLPRGHGWLAC
jgi:hypothetical protein